MGVDAIRAAFEDGAAFIPYLAAGDPGGDLSNSTPESAMAATADYVSALVDAGADVVELGLPFSEPIADGPTIQSATVRALQAGMTPPRYLELVESLDVDVPIVAMTYYNPIYRYGERDGVGPFVEAAAAAGVDGLIIPDLPVEESAPLERACREHDVALIFIAAPTTREDRLRAIMQRGTGYLYVQARLGTTGASRSVSDQTKHTLDRIAAYEASERHARLPKAVGFGISTGEQAATVVGAGADGVIVGSALVDIVAEGEDVVASLEELGRELKAGARAGFDRRTQ